MQKSLDKIHEVYMGENSSVFTQKTRERIHWICEQCVGKQILDVGCSQGTIPLLLGQAGKHVLGIDVEAEAISYAQNLLNQEPEEVRKRVAYQCCDVLSFLADTTYDTVILTEVLEHILDVDSVLKMITSLINPDGRIIITVPFGINDFWDHKRTYYVAQLYKQLVPYYAIDAVKLFDNWIGVVGRKQSMDKNDFKLSTMEIALIEAEEEAFYKRERLLINDRDRYKKACQEQKAATYHAVEEVGSLKEKLLREKNDVTRWRERAERLQEQIEALKAQSVQARSDTVRWKERAGSLQEQVENLKEQCEQRKNDTIRWRERAETLQEQVRKLKDKIVQDENTVSE